MDTKMRACLAVLQDRFAVVEPTFAFPFGKSSSELIDIVKRLGVLCALTAKPQVVRSDSDPHNWGRFEVMQADTAATLAACLDGRYEMMWQWQLDRIMRRIRQSVSAQITK
jgi:hypothetical protein